MENPVLVLVIICVAALAFLLLREIFCWYWKINSLVKSQERICGLLEKISREQGRFSSALESSLKEPAITSKESRETAPENSSLAMQPEGAEE
jgi:hypothetical protein